MADFKSLIPRQSFSLDFTNANQLAANNEAMKPVILIDSFINQRHRVPFP